jgi:hypothetical protein
MHPRTEHLLTLRDGGLVAADVREHVTGCAQCRTHLEDLETVQWRLQSLPPVTDAAPRGWPGVRARRAQREHAEHNRAVFARVAVAASVAVIAVAIAWRTGETPVTARIAPTQSNGMSAGTTADALALNRVAQLQDQSRALDAVMSQLGERPAVERAGSAVPIESLEAQVQWVDHQLSTGGDAIGAQSAEQLWRERVDLMHSLVRLRYVEAQTIAM